MEALLDSDASVLVLEKWALKLLEELNVNYQKLFSIIETADGSALQIEGYVWLPIQFSNHRN